MKKVLTSAILLALTSTAVNAMSLNVRHEFMDSKGNSDYQHKDRLVLDHRFANGIGLSAEVKWQNPKGEAFGLEKLSSAGHETKISYNYKVTDTFTLQPAYAIDAGNDEGATHKFDITGSQKLTNDWNIGLRYRYGDSNKVDGKDTHYNQFNLTSGYTVDTFKFGLDIEYKLDQSSAKGFEGDSNYLNLVSVSSEYTGFESGWRPFAEFAMVAVDSETDAGSNTGKDAYAPRYRVGLKYSF